MAEGSVSSAWVEVVPDFTDFRRTSNRQMTDILGGAGDESGSSSGKRFSTGFGAVLGGSFFGNILSDFAFNIGSAINRGFQAGLDFIGDSITQASDLNESANALEVSFGGAAGAISDMGKNAAQDLGLSNVDFNSIATQFSAFASTIRGSDVPGFIDELTTRGADFASVYNLDVADAMALFQSGLAGETEPLRKFGIDLSAAAVEGFAYANGIAAAGEPLTEAQKQQARYGLLLQQTAATAGDFENTQGSLANQQRILSAEWANAQATLGMALLPALTELANMANTTLVPAFKEIIAQVGPGLGQALTDATPSLIALGTTIADNLPTLVSLANDALPAIIQGLTVLIPWLIDTAAAFANGWTQITTWVSQVVTAFQNGGAQLGAFFGAVGAWIGSMIGAFMNGAAQIGAFFASVGAAFANGWAQISAFFASVGAAFANGAAQVGQFAASVGAKIGEAIGFVASLPGRAAGAIGDLGGMLVKSGRALIQGFIDGITAMIGKVGDAIGGVMDFAAGFFPHSPAERGPFSGAGWRAVAEGGSALADQFSSGFNANATLTPSIASGVSLSRFRAEGAGFGSPGSGSPVNVTQYVQDNDPRLWARQFGRELSGAMAGGPR